MVRDLVGNSATRTPRRAAVLALAAALAATACRSGRGDGARPPVTPPTSAATTTSTVALAPVDYAAPGAPESLGSGLVAGAVPDGSALYVADQDPAFAQPGCEGQPEPVLFRLPLDGSGRTRLGPPDRPLRGRLLPGPGGWAALIDECEGFLQSVTVGRQSPGGDLTELRPVSLDQVPATPEPARVTGWSADGASLLVAGRRGTTPAAGQGVILAVTVADGAVSEVLVTGRDPGPSQVEQLADGTLALAGGGRVSLRTRGGEELAAAAALGFTVVPGRRRVVAYGEGLVVLAPRAPTVVLVSPAPGRTVLAAAVSPDGRAVAYALDENDRRDVVVRVLEGEAPVAVVLPAGAGAGGQQGRPTFSADGRFLAFNRFGSGPDDDAEVLVVRFEV